MRGTPQLPLLLPLLLLLPLGSVGRRARSAPRVDEPDASLCATGGLESALPRTPTLHWKDDRARELIREGRAVVLLGTGLVETARGWSSAYLAAKDAPLGSGSSPLDGGGGAGGGGATPNAYSARLSPDLTFLNLNANQAEWSSTAACWP